MANQITIKSGASKPTTSKLADKEMGFDTRAKKLYIRNGSNIVGLSDFLPITGGTVSGPLTVIGRTALDGSLTVGSTLNANGKLNARQGLGVTGAADISGRFTAMSTIKSYGKISANGGLDVNGRLAANQDLIVTGASTLNGGLTANNSVTLNEGLTVNGNVVADRITPRFSNLRIGKNQNLNDYTTPGLYYCDLDVDAKTISNNPILRSFGLIVTKQAGVSQILVDYSTYAQEIYHRNYYKGTWEDKGTWGSWEKLDVYTVGTTADLGYYKKHADGILECWYHHIPCGAPTMAYGSIYCSENDTVWTFPHAFAEKPVVTVGLREGSTLGWAGFGAYETTTKATSFRAYRPTKYGGSSQTIVGAYAIGWWK